MTKKKMTDEEFEAYFDDGGDTTSFMVQGTLRHPEYDTTPKSLSINPPTWIVDILDSEASRMGISRKAVINIWLAEKADHVLEDRAIA